jgi:prepilin-type N-terminal cleavage/methylation domain-containing protein
MWRILAVPNSMQEHPMRLLSEAFSRLRRPSRTRGFSLIEMLVSITIIILLMSAVFPFLFQAQKRFQSNVVASEANQSARAALEVISQEIGQSGYNPQYYPNKTTSTSITLNGTPYWCLTLDNISGINPGDWVSVGTGSNNELLQVFATSTSNAVTTAPYACQPNPPVAPWIQVKPLYNHTTTPYQISSYKMPYGSGLLYLSDNSLSNDQRLEFFGDINQDSTQSIDYVIYSISPMLPATTVCIPSVAAGTPCPAANTYTLYNLYRSITPVPFPSLPTPVAYVPTCPGTACNNQASPMVEKVLYNATNSRGPTGAPIFSYPSTITVGVIPNQITVVGTIVITLCVAVNPQAMESGQVTWSTLATQIRPLNLSAAININNSNGGLYLPPAPKSLPMRIPSGYYP